MIIRTIFLKSPLVGHFSDSFISRISQLDKNRYFSNSPALQVYGGYGLDEIEDEIFDTPNTCKSYSQFDNRLTPHFLDKAKFQQLVNVMNNDLVVSSENTSEISHVLSSGNTNEIEST